LILEIKLQAPPSSYLIKHFKNNRTSSFSFFKSLRINQTIHGLQVFEISQRTGGFHERSAAKE
jgi:hypothetical protein